MQWDFEGRCEGCKPTVEKYIKTEMRQRKRLTATSIVFSCPTRLISEVQVLRVMTAAMKTKPLLLVALEAVICAPSGDQLGKVLISAKETEDKRTAPQTSEKSTSRRILERLCDFSF